jgi:hypothetical protein
VKKGNILVSMAMIFIVVASGIGHVAAEENTKTKITISFDLGDHSKNTYNNDGISLRGGGRVGGARIGGGKIGGGKVGGVKAPAKISSPPKNAKSGNVENVKSSKPANNIAGERSTGIAKGVGSSQYNGYRPSPLSPDYYSARRFDGPAPSHSFFGPIPWWYYPILFNSGSHGTGGNTPYNQSSNSSSWK